MAQAASPSAARAVLLAYLREGTMGFDAAAEASWCDPADAGPVAARLAAYRPYRPSVADPLQVQSEKRLTVSFQILRDGSDGATALSDGSAKLEPRSKGGEPGWCIARIGFQPPPVPLPGPL